MKRSDIIFLLTSSVILTIAWVIFSIIHASITTTITGDVSQEIQPIAASFDLKTISSLRSRQIVNPLFSLSGGASSSGTVTQQPTVTATPTPSVILPPLIPTQTSVATQGGTTP